MNDAYRDETESLRARNAQLEQEVAELRARIADQDAVFRRLEGVIDQREKKGSRSGRAVLLGGAALACVGIVAGVFAPRLARSSPPPMSMPTPIQVSEAAPHADAPDCSRPGVHLTLAGEDAFAPASGTRDLAGHKYRRDGSRSPWLTVQGGPLHVHAVGNYLPGDVGTTQLSLLTVITKGETGGYTLARDGKSLVEVTASDGKHIQGRLEADVSKVDDTTRTPPFGTPVVRLRGTFCLPALPANPSDTGP